MSGPVGLPVGAPLVWNDGCSIAKEVATSAAKMAMTGWNFIGRSQQLSVPAPTGKEIGKKRSRRQFSHLARPTAGGMGKWLGDWVSVDNDNETLAWL